MILVSFGIQQSFAEETLDFENCNGFLSADEVKSTIGYDGQITQDARGVTPVDEPFGLKTMCGSTFESADGTIGMTLVVMDSVDTAIELYVENRNSITAQDFEVREYLTFWNNFDVVLNDQGLGSLMVSQYDKFFLRFRTGIDEDKQAIADVEQLRVLSTIVQKKILDLPDVPISPPNPIPDIDEGPTTDEPPPKPGPAPIEEGELLSPKKQVSQGIDPAAVKCNEGLVLIIKHNGSPACVRPDTAENLEERSWGSMPPPCCKPTDASLEMEHATSSYSNMHKLILILDDFRNTSYESQDIDTIFFKFGDPSDDIGSGIHIYVYELKDSNQIWIGYSDKILYVHHVDIKGNILETLFQNE